MTGREYDWQLDAIERAHDDDAGAAAKTLLDVGKHFWLAAEHAREDDYERAAGRIDCAEESAAAARAKIDEIIGNLRRLRTAVQRE